MVKDQNTQHEYDYRAFSQLAGPFSRLPKGKNYAVEYRRLTSKGNALKALSLILVNFAIETAFLGWLAVAFYSFLTKEYAPITPGLIVILVSIVIIEVFRLINMVNLCAATLGAKNPVPIRPERGKRIAFTTTIVPSKEPFSMVEKTLIAMKKVKHQGVIDIWLLDEGNDKAIKKACRELGVKHFSRKDVEKWNQPSGRFKAKTKHGNHNAWLDAHGDDYDYVLSVDSDHIPLPNFAERLLGYFRDPNVAFVVGPQVYGNYDNPITKGAESQAYIFQAAIQRSGNSYHSAMFVGTNHAYRVSAWDQIGGFQDSITEDMLTGMRIHSSRNPLTKKFWKSVYTPDVVAVGEGPSSWTDFFSQQFRWARGGNEVLVRNFLGFLFRLPWRAKIFYTMIIGYYPIAALSWLIGVLVTGLFLVLGEDGVDVGSKIWFALYFDVLAAQVILYGWMRKYNVSPHEERGTLGVPGMLVTMLCAPIYASAFVKTILRRKTSFVVTPKGSSSSPDRLLTFKDHIMWGALIVGFLAYSSITGNSYPEVKIWSILTLAICFIPLLMWSYGAVKPGLKRLVHIIKTRKITGYQEVA
ncbi:MAG TPA: glycosyltransferase family 2 protein [Candidatus Saccharimonadales bacterium]|nr:glycosyltransferase family 2 protein [Candidatus Saccharimonadales bacterium]